MINYKTKAKELTYVAKKNIIQKYIGKENDFHHIFKKLLERIYNNPYIEILQGPDEKGKDIVMENKNPMGNTYAAFVIKAIEKLNGSASGKTSEIVMQIIQSFGTPANLKDMYEPVNISFVYVVNLGTISNSAKENILNNYIKNDSHKNAVEFIDINKLVGLFEEYYPEFFFNNTFDVLLKERMDKIEEFLNTKNGLSDFIDPNIKKFTRNNKELIIGDDNNNTLKRMADQIFGEKENLKSFLKISTTKKSKKILLTGDAGSGKSILVYKMILTSINEFLQSNLNIVCKNKSSEVNLPICFRAVEFQKEDLNDFVEKIDSFYRKELCAKPNLIVIDGIDEVDNRSRETIITKIESYAELNGNINILLTSRVNYTIIDSLKEYENYELMPFSINQAINFVKKIVKDNNNFLNIEKNIKELENQIPFYPLALRLLVDIVKDKKEIPASITELYNRYMELIFGKYNTNISIDKLFEPKVKDIFFSSLAYECFFYKNKTCIKRVDFYEFIKKFCQKYNFIDDIDSFTNNIERISIIRINDEGISFSHKSFLDYFIALYFINNKEELDNFADTFYNLYVSDEIWEDVSYFYFGLRTKITPKDLMKIIKNIEKLDDRFLRSANFMFLGKLLQYGWMTESSVKMDTINMSIKNSLELKKGFDDNIKEILKVTPPKVLSSVAMIHMVRLCYSSIFVKQEMEKIISNILVKQDMDECYFYFCTIYTLVNIDLLGKEYVSNILMEFLLKIECIKDTDFLENKILITEIINMFYNQNKLGIDENFKRHIDKIIKHNKKKYPDLRRSIFSTKNKKDYLLLSQK